MEGGLKIVESQPVQGAAFTGRLILIARMQAMPDDADVQPGTLLISSVYVLLKNLNYPQSFTKAIPFFEFSRSCKIFYEM